MKRNIADGGLAICALEMAFASRCGLELDIGTDAAPLPALFAEELGAVIAVRADSTVHGFQRTGSSPSSASLTLCRSVSLGNSVRI